MSKKPTKTELAMRESLNVARKAISGRLGEERSPQDITLAIIDALDALRTPMPYRVYVDELHILCSAIFAELGDLPTNEVHPYSISGYKLEMVLRAIMSIHHMSTIRMAMEEATRPLFWLPSVELEELRRGIKEGKAELRIRDWGASKFNEPEGSPQNGA